MGDAPFGDLLGERNKRVKRNTSIEDRTAAVKRPGISQSAASALAQERTEFDRLKPEKSSRTRPASFELAHIPKSSRTQDIINTININVDAGNDAGIWVCVGMSDGCMIKVPASKQQSVEEFQQILILRLRNFIQELEAGSLCAIESETVPASVNGSPNPNPQNPLLTGKPKRLDGKSLLLENYNVDDITNSGHVPIFWTYPNSLKKDKSKLASIRKSVIPTDVSENLGLYGSGPFGLVKNNPTSGRSPKKYLGLLQKGLIGHNLESTEKTRTILKDSILFLSYARQQGQYKENEEIFDFRRNVMSNMILLQPKAKILKLYSVVTKLSWPNFLNSSFRTFLRFDVPPQPHAIPSSPQGVSKFIDCLPSMKISEILKKSLEKYQISSDHTFSVKFTGTAEYLHPSSCIGSIIRIRELLTKRLPIQITILQNNSQIYSEEDNFAKEYEIFYDNKFIKQQNASVIIERDEMNSFNVDSQYSICPIKIKNLQKFFPIYVEESLEGITQFQVEIAIYHGQSLLSPPLWSSLPNSEKIDSSFPLKISQVSLPFPFRILPFLLPLPSSLFSCILFLF